MNIYTHIILSQNALPDSLLLWTPPKQVRKLSMHKADWAEQMTKVHRVEEIEQMEGISS